MASGVTRREVVKGSLAAAVGATAALGLGGAARGGAAEPQPAPPQGAATSLPRGKIKDLEIGRLLLGGNILTHCMHGRDLRYVDDLARHYNTKEKILQTMALAESHGINTVVLQGIIPVFKEYREKRGGKMLCIYGPVTPVDDGLVKYDQAVREVLDAGVDAVYFWGVHADALAAQKKIDVIGKAVDIGRSYGVPSGVAAHNLEVITSCEQAKIAADFYIKTLHHHNYPSAKLGHDSIWCPQPEETIEVMKGVAKPWIAFKVLAAGAIAPQDGFRYAFAGGADFILAGMFDFQVAEDARITRQVLSDLPARTRPWRG